MISKYSELQSVYINSGETKIFTLVRNLGVVIDKNLTCNEQIRKGIKIVSSSSKKKKKKKKKASLYEEIY